MYYNPNITPQYCDLGEEESSHLKKVMRAVAGDEIKVGNGKGLICHCEIIEISKKFTKLKILNKEEFKPEGSLIHIFVAPTKNASRMEWLVEKAVELGVSTITPLICRRSERRNLNLKRIHKVAISALKQSERPFLPILNTEVRFATFFETNKLSNAYIAHCMSGEKYSLKMIKPETETILFIGPEGDFTEDEIKLAIDKGVRPLNLGKWRLRTETSAIMALNIINYLNSSYE